MSLTDIVGNTACDHIMRSDLGQGVRTVFRLSLLSRAENLCLHCCISVPTKEVVVIPDNTDTDIDTYTDSQSGSARISSFLAPIV